MNGQPDISAALAWSEQVIRDASYVMAALRGEPTPPLRITSVPDLAAAEASPANPYGSFDRGRYDAASEPAWCEQRGPDGRFICALTAGHSGYHEAQGASPLPAWLDSDTDYTYPEGDAASAAEVAQGVENPTDPIPACGHDHATCLYCGLCKACGNCWCDGNDAASAAEVAQGVEGAPPFHVTGTSAESCAEEHQGYICTAQRGHGGPDHIAYVPGDDFRWPAASAAGVAQGVPMPGVPAADVFLCCATPMRWPTAGEDRTCPDCLTVWEREPVDLGAGARIKHQPAASAAEVAEDVEPGRCEHCGVPDDQPGHHFGCPASSVDNPDLGRDDKTYPEDWDMWGRPRVRDDLCPAQWGVPPETMLCSLASGHDGNHATAEGIEWAGKWETAEVPPKDVLR